ncbi:Uncharacterised protein [Kluyvera cryocrescens]|uniref:Uncharacterized protein n=1 Tax=Kluyvera cryocrescens TaxID=580 RepID=A0A485CZP9_KLUCR|nr:Uncharacterised protein [Kluyvera cryocrescens]
MYTSKAAFAAFSIFKICLFEGGGFCRYRALVITQQGEISMKCGIKMCVMAVAMVCAGMSFSVQAAQSAARRGW